MGSACIVHEHTHLSIFFRLNKKNENAASEKTLKESFSLFSFLFELNLEAGNILLDKLYENFEK